MHILYLITYIYEIFQITDQEQELENLKQQNEELVKTKDKALDDMHHQQNYMADLPTPHDYAKQQQQISFTTCLCVSHACVPVSGWIGTCLVN